MTETERVQRMDELLMKSAVATKDPDIIEMTRLLIERNDPFEIRPPATTEMEYRGFTGWHVVITAFVTAAVCLIMITAK